MAAVERTVLLKSRDHELGPKMTCGRDMAIRMQMPAPHTVAKENDLPFIFEDERWAAWQAQNSWSAGLAQARHNGPDALVRVSQFHGLDLMGGSEHAAIHNQASWKGGLTRFAIEPGERQAIASMTFR